MKNQIQHSNVPEKLMIFKDFKAFAFKGNLIDMAVGIIIGGAFGTVVKSLVDNIFMPPLGILTGKVNFSARFLSLDGHVYPTPPWPRPRRRGRRCSPTDNSSPT